MREKKKALRNDNLFDPNRCKNKTKRRVTYLSVRHSAHTHTVLRQVVISHNRWRHLCGWTKGAQGLWYEHLMKLPVSNLYLMSLLLTDYEIPGGKLNQTVKLQGTHSFLVITDDHIFLFWLHRMLYTKRLVVEACYLGPAKGLNLMRSPEKCYYITKKTSLICPFLSFQ